MSKVFIGGSRSITRIPAAVQVRLDRIVERGLRVLVGDAPGVDTAIQRDLQQRGHRNVTVYCSGTKPRNNVGGWPVEAVPVPAGVQGFAFYSVKDRAMVRDADYGLILWDGDSAGSAMQALRLLLLGKPVVLHHAPSGADLELRSIDHWALVSARLGATLERRLRREAKSEGLAYPTPETTGRTVSQLELAPVRAAA
jgi:hypothetical protein